jgi:hypothetical protein
MRHQTVRDLVSVMGAPGLLNGQVRSEILTDLECHEELQRRMRDLEMIDQDPRVLNTWLESGTGSPQLGRYFEALLAFWIRDLMKAPHFEAGLKILRDRATVGELDFVYQFGDAPIQHWEASVKFYLCTARTLQEARDPSFYVGTMTRDRLDLKMNKLLDQQLGLARLPIAIERLHALGFTGPIQSRALVKGALFYPIESDWRAHEFPSQVNPGHARGWWSHQFPKGAEDSRWAILDKRRWLSRFQAGPEFTPLTHSEVTAVSEKQVDETRRAFMVARLAREDTLWVEQERGLVVHPGWPWPEHP